MVDKELNDQVVDVRYKSDRTMSIKVVVGVEILNVLCLYATQRRLTEDIKREFWEELEKVI